MYKKRPWFYDYLEVRQFGATHGIRHKKVPLAHPSVDVHFIKNYRPSTYPWWNTVAFEQNIPVAEAIDPGFGVWPINHCRVDRRLGDPGRFITPMESLPRTWPKEAPSIAHKMRLHHYSRIHSSTEAARRLMASPPLVLDIRLSLEISSDWYAPPNGIICDYKYPTLPTAVHSVPLVMYDPLGQLFQFQNSWGGDWGDNGCGALSHKVFDTHITDAWMHSLRGLGPHYPRDSGIIELLWKLSDGQQSVHGRELVDSDADERLAWAFCIQRDSFLDLEEFFVWPGDRGKGYGRRLSQLVKELRVTAGRPLRAWISFADCESHNQESLKAAMRMLELYLHDSPVRWAGYVADENDNREIRHSVRFPPKPGSTHDTLKPSDEDMLRDVLESAIDDLEAIRISPKSSSQRDGRYCRPYKPVFDNDKNQEPRLFPVFYGTNRNMNDEDNVAKGFGNSRSNIVTYGSCVVSIPKGHVIGSVGSRWLKRMLQRLRTGSDDSLKLQLLSKMHEHEMWRDVHAKLADCESDHCHALLYIHGYNTSFEQAALRAAQLGYDLRIPGATGFFSWPSMANPLWYAADVSALESSEECMCKFICDFVRHNNNAKVHVVAHSMGNRGFLRVISNIISRAVDSSRVKFGQVFLAAPDVDVDVFRRLAAHLPSQTDQTTLYVSRRDLPLGMSGLIHNYSRAGYAPPITIVEGIDTVLVDGFDLLELAHGYYAEAHALLTDIFTALHFSVPPTRRLRLQSARTSSGEQYWTLPISSV